MHPSEEAEGLRLHLSGSSSTRYKGVYEHSGRFLAQRTVDGEKVSLGIFDTAMEAAAAYARAVGGAEAGGGTVLEAEGGGGGLTSQEAFPCDYCGRLLGHHGAKINHERACARLNAPSATVVAEAEGLQLHLSSSSCTGYSGALK